MKYAEKIKTEKILQRIQNGQFDEIDVDSLFTKLREYAPFNSVFKEIAHYLAHNKEREQGLTKDALHAFQLNMRFVTEYSLPKKQLDIYNMPLWVKELMILQIYKTDEKTLKDKHNLSRDRLRNKIQSWFKDDKKAGITKFKKQRVAPETSEIFNTLLGVIHSQNAFTSENLFDDLIKILDKQKLEYEKDKLMLRKDKVILCVMYVIHGTEFILDEDGKASCALVQDISDSAGKSSYRNRHVNQLGEFFESPDDEENFELGTLAINGTVSVDHKGKPLQVSFPILSTDLKVVDWVDASLMEVRRDAFQYVAVDMTQDMHINEHFKLAGENEPCNFDEVEYFTQKVFDVDLANKMGANIKVNV